MRNVNHEVEGESLEHQFLVSQDAVPPAPVLLALLVDDQLGVLLRNLCDGDDEILCFAGVFLGLVRKEESSGRYVLIYGKRCKLVSKT